MKKAVIIIPLSAILLLLALPSYMSAMNNVRDAAGDRNVEKLADELVDITIDEVKDKLTAPLIAVVLGVLVFIGGLLGVRIIFR